MYLGRNPAVGTQKMLDSIESQFNGALATFDLRYGGVPTYPTLSESLIVSLGGVLQEPGEAYYVSSDKIVFSEAPATGTECWILLYSQYGAAVSSVPSLAIQTTGEPMGFENRTHSSISFNNGSRTFSIAPNTSGGYSSYAVWTKGTKRTISGTLSVQVGTSTGLYYIYFDAFGDLQYKTTYFTWDTETPVAYVYWNSATSSAPFVADERHGIVLDWATHEYLHRTRGAVIAEGFSISAYTTTGNGSANAHAQFDLGNGTFFDEDLEVNITHSASPTVGTFTQVLTGAAEIPVFYMSGSSGAWVRDTPTEYACKQSATTLQYNSLSGGTWSTAPADNNRYVVSWIVATNEINAPVIAILGQEQYTAIGTAEAVKFGNLTLTNFPIVEFRPLWKVIFQTSTGFTNVPNALIANVLDLRQLSETGEAGTVVSDHGLLSGLADDDHAQYLHATIDRVGVSANITTTGNLGSANLTLTGELRGPSTLVIDPAAVGDNTGTVEIKGNLTVQGTTTTINSTTLTVDDKNIVLADGQSTLAGIDTAGIDFGSTAVRLRYNYNGGTNSGLSIEGTNVGIGTTNPGQLLELYGSNKLIKINSATDNSSIAIGQWDIANNRIESVNRPLYITTYTGNINFGPSNSQVLSITQSSNVGIGTTTPSYKLDVEGSQNVTTQISLWGRTIGQPQTLIEPGRIYATAAGLGPGDLLLQPTGGNIGIGTTSAVEKLHIHSEFLGLSAIRLSGSAALQIPYDIRQGIVGVSNAGFSIYDVTAAATRFAIDSAGNIGVGTGNPSYKFSVLGTSGRFSDLLGNTIQVRIAASEGGWNSLIGFASNSGTFLGGMLGNGTSQSLVDLRLGVGSAPNSLIINSSGNVGIGITDPLALLHVYGNVNPRARIQSLTSSAAGLDLVNTAGGATSYLDSSANLRFYLGSDRVTFTQSGNVGIGTTNPGVPLDVKGIDSLIRASEAGSGTAWRSRIISQNPDGAVQRASFLGIYGTSAGVFAHNSALNGWAPLFVNTTNGSSDGDTVILAGSGNVGIGTVNPIAKTHIRLIGDTAQPVLYLHRANNSGGGAGNPEIGLQVDIPNTYNSAGAVYGVKVFARHNLGSEHYGGYFEAGGNAYSSGIGVYAKTTHTDTNGPGYQPAILADAYSNIGTSNSGYAVGVLAQTNDYVNNINAILKSNYTGSSSQTALRIERNGSYVGYITTSQTTSSFLISSSSGLVGDNVNQISLYTGSSPKLTITSTGNVGIGTTNPITKLSVNGEISVGQDKKLSFIGLDINGSFPSYLKIRTSIPFVSTSADFTVNIKGFRYNEAQIANLSISWHFYNGIFWNPAIISSGSWAPTVVLSNENDLVCITLYSPGYWPKLYVESMYSSVYSDSYCTGWSWVDEAPGGTNNVTVSYKSDFGNLFVMTSNGNVGVGTGSPTQKLEVNGNLLVGSPNYNNSNSPIIRLGHQSANLTDGSQRGVIQFDSIQDISVNSGDAWKWKIATVARAGNAGNYNSQFEILRTTRFGVTDNTDFCISRDGNVGIGTTSPIVPTHIFRSTSGTALKLNNGTGGSGSYIDLDFDTYLTSQVGYANAAASIRVINDGFFSGHIAFRTKGASVGADQSEKLRITSLGNVGIGTTNPVTRFHIHQAGDDNGITISHPTRPGIWKWSHSGVNSENFAFKQNNGTSDAVSYVMGRDAHYWSVNNLETFKIVNTSNQSVARSTYPFHTHNSPMEIRLDSYLAGNYLYSHGGHFFMNPFVRGDSNVTVDILTLSNILYNCGVTIFLEIIAASATTTQGCVIDGAAYLQRSEGSTSYNTAVNLTKRHEWSTGIGNGTLSWSGLTLRYTTVSPSYTKYQIRAHVTSHDGAIVTTAF